MTPVIDCLRIYKESMTLLKKMVDGTASTIKSELLPRVLSWYDLDLRLVRISSTLLETGRNLTFLYLKFVMLDVCSFI